MLCGQSDNKSGVVKEPSESQEDKDKMWERNSCTRCPNGEIYFNIAESQREAKDPTIQRKSPEKQGKYCKDCDILCLFVWKILKRSEER